MAARPAAAAMAMLAATLAPSARAAETGGEALFRQHCAACHQPDGSGIPGLAPPLAKALGRQLASPRAAEYLAQVAVSGIAGPITVNGQMLASAMPGVPQLADAEIAAILNHVVRGLNGGTDDRVSAADVAAARARKAGPGDTLRLRRELVGG
jgi:mono/diheme cytochrome c family protein